MPRNILLLQGPVGPFFKKFARQLESHGHNVLKVNLNGGDLFYFRSGKYLNFTSPSAVWPAWIENVMVGRKIDRLYLFGDCRRYHRQAIDIARRVGVEVYVFEEGYVRPNYVTLEKDGVNGFSSACKKPEILTHLANTEKESEDLPSEPVSNVFWNGALHVFGYYSAALVLRSLFKHYDHHRSLNVVTETMLALRSGIRKIAYRVTERQVSRRLLSGSEKYFLLPLQVHFDMQVKQHSKFSSIESFIEQMISSFSQAGREDCSLVIKHHPYDRGYKNYSTLIKKMALVYGLEGRLFYVHDTDLPTLLQNAEGSVLINSTVGISSMYHGTPVKALGDAIYDVEGLTHQGSLDTFWHTPDPVNRELFSRFRQYLINKTQVNGSLYTAVTNADSSGLLWPEALAELHFSDEIERISEDQSNDNAANPIGSNAGNGTANIIDLENHKSSNDGDYDQSGFDTGTDDKIAV